MLTVKIVEHLASLSVHSRSLTKNSATTTCPISLFLTPSWSQLFKCSSCLEQLCSWSKLCFPELWAISVTKTGVSRPSGTTIAAAVAFSLVSQVSCFPVVKDFITDSLCVKMLKQLWFVKKKKILVPWQFQGQLNHSIKSFFLNPVPSPVKHFPQILASSFFKYPFFSEGSSWL